MSSAIFFPFTVYLLGENCLPLSIYFAPLNISSRNNDVLCDPRRRYQVINENFKSTFDMFDDGK